jgi:hypothetical protein
MLVNMIRKSEELTRHATSKKEPQGFAAQLQEDMQNRLIARKEEFDKKRDERNLLHQSILNLGNIPRRIVAEQGELMSETGRQLSALTAASLGGQQTSEKPIYQVKQYY